MSEAFENNEELNKFPPFVLKSTDITENIRSIYKDISTKIDSLAESYKAETDSLAETPKQIEEQLTTRGWSNIKRCSEAAASDIKHSIFLKTREYLTRTIYSIHGEVSKNSILHATDYFVWLKQSATSIGMQWIEPNITASPENEIVFEWWAKNKKLSVFFIDDVVQFIKVWGPNIDHDMEEGLAENRQTILECLRWLLS
jgi:hypothetical protein